MKTDWSVLKSVFDAHRTRAFLGVFGACVATLGLSGCTAFRPDSDPVGLGGPGAYGESIVEGWERAPGADEDTEPGQSARIVESKMGALQLTVEQAVAEALTYNRSVQSARLAAAIGVENEKEARAALLPSLRLGASYNRVDEPPSVNSPDLGGSFTAGPREVFGMSLDLGFPIYGFGRYLNGYRAARLTRRSAEVTALAAESDMGAAVTAAAFDLLEGKRAIGVARANEASLDQQVKDAEALLAVGRVTRSAKLEAEVLRDQARREREKLESAIPILRKRLNTLMGRPVDTATQVVDAPVTAAPPWQLEALETEAMDLRPELRAARLDVEAAKRSAQAAVGRELPELRGNVNFATDNSPFGSPSDQTTLRLTLDVPLFTGGARYARIRRARRQTDLAKLALRDLEANVRTEVAIVFRNVTESYRDIAVARLNIERAEESLRIQREKFRNGRATSREVLESTALLTDSNFAYVRALYTYNVALRDLHRARGADPRANPMQGLVSSNTDTGDTR